MWTEVGRLLRIIGDTDPTPLPVSQQDPLEANRLADAILSDASYRVPQPSLAERVFRWVGRQFERAFDNVAGFDGGQVLGLAVVGILLLAVGYLVFRTLRAPASARAPRHSDAVHYDTEHRTGVAEWRAEAMRLAGAGDHVGALRCWFQATVAMLVGARVVGDQPGATAGELRVAVATHLPLAGAAFDRLVDRFESAWYGGATVSAGDVHDAQEQAEMVAAVVEGQPTGVVAA